MEESALKKPQVLITDVGSYLGSSLAFSFLSQNASVWGIGQHVTSELLSQKDFTLLEIDLAQPFPAHLPRLDLIFYLTCDYISSRESLTIPSPSPAMINILSTAKSSTSRLAIVVPIFTDIRIYEQLAKDREIQKLAKLFLVGDLYGPGMPLEGRDRKLNSFSHNELTTLISQAVKTDKVILEKEGLTLIYPTYITDAVFAVSKLAASTTSKNIHVIVSESAKTSLSLAYEIQNVAQLILGKELGLFFAGPAIQVTGQGEPVVKAQDLGFDPRVEITEGLKNTFNFFKNQGQIESAKPQSESLPRTPLPTPRPSATILQSPPRSWLPKFTPSEKTLAFMPGMKRILSGEERTTAFRPWESIFHPKITSQIPHFFPSSRLKALFLLILATSLFLIAKTSLDLYLATRAITKAKVAVSLGDFTNAKSHAAQSTSSYRSAAKTTQILTFPLSLILPQKVQAANLALTSAVKGSSSLAYFIEGAESLAKDLSIIVAEDKTDGLDLETPAANFKRAYNFSSQAKELATLSESRIWQIGLLGRRLKNAQDSFGQISELSSSTLELTNILNDLIGSSGKKTYLILLQNNTELRAGGGFIGNFGEIRFENGKLKNVTVEDIYTVDGQLKEKIEPPRELKEKLGVDRFYLRDSNWSADFELNGSTARDFYKKETGQDVDGVIALDLTFIQNLLSKIGPIKLVDYNEEITAQNLFERGEYYSEVGFFPGSTQKRDFFGALTRALVAKITASLKITTDESPPSQIPWLALVEVTKEALGQKHLMLSFDNPTLATFVKTKGFNHPLPPLNFDPADDSVETRDLLVLSEANLGANKVNRFLKREIAYEVTVGRDADLVAKLKITYVNESQAETWPQGTYVNFLRVYTPFNVSLLDYQNGDKKDLKDIEISSLGGLSVLSTFVEVPVKSTRQIIITYRIPKNIKLEKAPFYHLYIVKQPGTERDPLTITFNLPNYLAVKSVNDSDVDSGKQNLTISTDLSTDRQFEIEVVKK